jgi:hypothetical protein
MKGGANMIIVYLLFALTLSTILVVIFGATIPEQKRSDAFIAFFAALMLVAWAVDAWFLPDIAIKGVGTWVPDLAVSIFGAILVIFTVIASRSQGPLMRAGVYHSMRQDAMAIGFDIVLLILMVAFGIIVLRSIMMY